MREFLFDKAKFSVAALAPLKNRKVFKFIDDPKQLCIKTITDVTTKEWNQIKALPGYIGVYFGD